MGVYPLFQWAMLAIYVSHYQRVPSGNLTWLLKIATYRYLWLIYPLKMVILHCYLSHSQRVSPITQQIIKPRADRGHLQLHTQLSRPKTSTG